MGFAYKPVEELSAPHNYEELAHRLLHLEALQTRQRVDIERAAPVLIGTVKPDKVTITKALDIYLNEIALDEVAGKSPEQKVFEGLNPSAILIVYALIETGCRPSEIMNILPENIVLDHEVPHIRIRRQNNRQLKTQSSVRDIPLIGVSLEAMRLAPQGFPRYHDKGNLLSVSLLKAFRTRNLFPTKLHRIYSFRHSFEKRMLEAGLDYDLRCLLMGHKNTRLQYGDGGSLSYRRNQLRKICHPISDSFVHELKAICQNA